MCAVLPAPDRPCVGRANMQRTRQADRDGATEALAAAYQGSALRASNDERLRDDAAAALGLPAAMRAELGAASGTATPFAHGVWVLLKARTVDPCRRARQTKFTSSAGLHI